MARPTCNQFWATPVTNEATRAVSAVSTTPATQASGRRHNRRGAAAGESGCGWAGEVGCGWTEGSGSGWACRATAPPISATRSGSDLDLDDLAEVQCGESTFDT